jgi:hypothetical protein
MGKCPLPRLLTQELVKFKNKIPWILRVSKLLKFLKKIYLDFCLLQIKLNGKP